MSLAKINNFANDDTDILALQTTVDALYQNSYSLTEYDSTTVPAIAAGSKIEVNGSLYRAATEEAISTTDPVTSSAVADGTIYICMIPSGDASTCTAAFTSTGPVWSDSKQGWYGTGDYANYKYIGTCIKSTSSYTYKRLYLMGPILDYQLSKKYSSSYNTEFTYTSNSGWIIHDNLSLDVWGVTGDVFNVFYKFESYSASAPDPKIALVPSNSKSILKGYNQENIDAVEYSNSSSYQIVSGTTSYSTWIVQSTMMFVADGKETITIYHLATYGGSNPTVYFKNTSITAIKI